MATTRPDRGTVSSKPECPSAPVRRNSTEEGYSGESGCVCDVAGTYRFDGYSDGSFRPAPQLAETQIALRRGEPLPLISSTGKACVWTLVEPAMSQADDDDPFDFLTGSDTLLLDPDDPEEA